MGKYRNKVSLKDIADRLGVSKYAISLALNDKPGVGEELRKQIIKLAHDMNYHGSKKKSIQESKNILVLIPEYIRNDAFFYYPVYWALEMEIKQHGYNAILTSVSTEMQEKLLFPNLYFDMEFSGIITIGIFNKEYIIKLLGSGLHVVSVDQYYDEIPMDVVVTANEEGAYEIVNYLIANGHKDIGYIGSIQMTASLYERWSGYCKAMLYNGLKVNEEHCILSSSPLNVLLADPDELGKIIDDMKSFPTAWFCGGDRIAINLINVLSRKNIKVPDDISVAGFDDLEASKMIIPSLTTVRVNRELMAKEAVDFLVRRIKNSDEKQKLSIYGKLVIRESVKKLG